MLTDEQRKAIEWAIGMASQHNIHNSPLRAILAAHSAGAHGEPVAWVTPSGEFSDENPRKFSDWTPLYARPQPTTDDVLKVLTNLRRKLAALPHRQIELALGEYQAWMLKGDAFDLIDAEIERIERAGVKP